MNPLAIKARNYRTFAELDLQLPAGCVAILGANGAGKSSLVNVIDLCLFGPETRSWGPYLTQGIESQRLELELLFEHDGETYRVRRGYSAAGSGKATLDLEQEGPDWHVEPDEHGDPVQVQSHPEWEPLTRETAAQTQALIEEILGLTRETFRASAMLAQGDGAAFTEAQPRERKAILAKILGLDRYDELLELVRRDSRATTKRIDELNGELQRADRELEERVHVEATLSGMKATLAEIEPQHKAAEDELDAAARAAQAGEELRRRKAEALVELTNATGRLQPLEQRLADSDEALHESAIAEDEIETIATPAQNASLEDRERDLIGKIEAHRAAVREREELVRLREMRETEKATIEAQADERERKALELDGKASHVALGEVEACPVCEQPLGDEARKATAGSLRAQAQEAAEAAASIRERAKVIEIPELPPEVELPTEAGVRLDVALEAVRERLGIFRDAALQRSRLEGRLQVLRERVSARPTDEELEAARATFRIARAAFDGIADAPTDEDIAVVQRSALAAKTRAEDLFRQIAGAKDTVTVASTTLARLKRIQEETAASRAERERHLRDVDRLAILDQAYGRDGIPSLIVGNVAIPSIETEAARILAELGTSYRLELRTERALAGGRTADALDVIVMTEAGERPYETFSGGERTRLNLALRIALARLLAHRRGAESRLLAIDEPEYLDQAGTAALANVLKGLAGDFERVYLISHVPDLRDAFDATVEVVKTEAGTSTIGGPS